MAMTTVSSDYATAKVAPRQAPDFTEPLATAAEDVASLRMRIERLADRLCGSVSEVADGGAGLREVTDGVFAKVVEHGFAISHNVRDAREALDRIERSLP